MSDTERPEQDDVEGHGLWSSSWSDERLKQAISQVDDALARLRELQGTSGEDEDVEGHALRAPSRSNEQLKQAISSLENAQEGLRAVGTTRS
jgi:hypothetical protein